MAVNRTVYGASGAAQGSITFQNGKLLIQFGTAPAFKDYITADGVGIIIWANLGDSLGPKIELYQSSPEDIKLTPRAGRGVALVLSGALGALDVQSGILRNTLTDGAFHFQGALASGQQFNVKHLTELTTIAAAATTDTAIEIPINAVVFAVSVRVTVVIPTAATFTVIGTTTSTAFNTAAVDVAANTTNVGTASCPYKNGAAQTIRITPSATPADNTGRVRVTIHYYDITVPTS